MKNQDGGEIWHIRLGFETVSWQHAAHIQKRSYSIHAEPFSRTPKSSKQKKGSASRVTAGLLRMAIGQNILHLSFFAYFWPRVTFSVRSGCFVLAFHMWNEFVGLCTCGDGSLIDTATSNRNFCKRQETVKRKKTTSFPGSLFSASIVHHYNGGREERHWERG